MLEIWSQNRLGSLETYGSGKLSFPVGMYTAIELFSSRNPPVVTSRPGETGTSKEAGVFHPRGPQISSKCLFRLTNDELSGALMLEVSRSLPSRVTKAPELMSITTRNGHSLNMGLNTARFLT